MNLKFQYYNIYHVSTQIIKIYGCFEMLTTSNWKLSYFIVTWASFNTKKLLLRHTFFGEGKPHNTKYICMYVRIWQSNNINNNNNSVSIIATRSAYEK